MLVGEILRGIVGAGTLWSRFQGVDRSCGFWSRVAGYLEKAGFRVLDRDWRDGEDVIDIVAVERCVFVVWDVKIHSGICYGAPLEAICRAKPGRLMPWRRWGF
jgi:hypothetical protein